MAAHLPVHRPSFLKSWWPSLSPTRPRADFDDFMQSLFGNGDLAESAIPPIDVSETDQGIDVRMDVPGTKPNDIDIQVNGNLLTITGKCEEQQEEKGRTFHRIERRAGQFSRGVTLPCAIKEDQVEAVCKEGVLSVHLPKSVEAKGRKIKVGS